MNRPPVTDRFVDKIGALRNKNGKQRHLWYNDVMIKRVIKKFKLRKNGDELKYWLSRPPSERVEAVERLRKQFDGSAKRFQRIIKIIQQA